MTAGEGSCERSQCFPVAFIWNVGEIAGDFQSHALVLSNRAHALLANAFVEIVDRDAEDARDLEEPRRIHG